MNDWIYDEGEPPDTPKLRELLTEPSVFDEPDIVGADKYYENPELWEPEAEWTFAQEFAWLDYCFGFDVLAEGNTPIPNEAP